MDPHDEERLGTIFFFIILVVVVHFGIWFSIFGVPDVRLIGFPIQYSLPVIMGWPIVGLIMWFYTQWDRRMQDRIFETELAEEGV